MSQLNLQPIASNADTKAIVRYLRQATESINNSLTSLDANNMPDISARISNMENDIADIKNTLLIIQKQINN